MAAAAFALIRVHSWLIPSSQYGQKRQRPAGRVGDPIEDIHAARGRERLVELVERAVRGGDEQGEERGFEGRAALLVEEGEEEQDRQHAEQSEVEDLVHVGEERGVLLGRQAAHEKDAGGPGDRRCPVEQFCLRHVRQSNGLRFEAQAGRFLF